METLQTGDILLFECTSKNTSIFSCFSHLIDCCSRSKFSHVGMILKSPTYINPKLTGMYMLESGAELLGNAEDKRHIIGVQITPIEEVLSYKGNIYVRKLYCTRDTDFTNKIATIHKEIHELPYDVLPFDWALALNRISNRTCWKRFRCCNFQKKNTFWCSALLAYIYVELGFLPQDLPWSLVAPKEFSHFERKELPFMNCELLPEELITKNIE